MPGTQDLQSYIEERLLDWDPDIDISDGSPAQVTIVEPLVRRFTPDPFEMDVPTFIRTRLEQEYTELNIDESDALMDLLVKPMEALLDPVIREVEFLRTTTARSSSRASPVEELLGRRCSTSVRPHRRIAASSSFNDSSSS